MDMRQELDRRAAEIDGIIAKYLPEEQGFQKTLLQAMNYSVNVGGKRLRPMLMEECYKLFGGQEKIIEPFMAAMEMMHSYSLVHDDLPAMDNDEFRRGMKTTHKVYGEAMAILAGDGLLNLAYETVARAFSMESSCQRTAKAFQVFANRAGIYGMVGGQSVDVEFEGKSVGKERLDFIYDLKTGALIEASMLIGAILAGASEQEEKVISDIAQAVGLAFQIQDDILDVTSTLEVLGKPIGSDDKNEKETYVTLLGLEQAKAYVEELSLKAVQMLDSLPVKNDFLRQMIIFMIQREK